MKGQLGALKCFWSGAIKAVRFVWTHSETDPETSVCRDNINLHFTVQTRPVQTFSFCFTSMYLSYVFFFFFYQEHGGVYLEEHISISNLYYNNLTSRFRAVPEAAAQRHPVKVAHAKKKGFVIMKAYILELVNSTS